jgi:hypothetical protein
MILKVGHIVPLIPGKGGVPGKGYKKNYFSKTPYFSISKSELFEA